MAAGEDQPQPIVDDRALIVHRWLLLLLGIEARQLGQPLGAIGHRPVAAQAIDRPPPQGFSPPRPAGRRRPRGTRSATRRPPSPGAPPPSPSAPPAPARPA